MKKTLLLFFILSLIQGESIAQVRQPLIDSLKTELKNAKQDTTRLRLYLALGEEIEERKEGLNYGEAALKLADKLLTQTTSKSQKKYINKQKVTALIDLSHFYESLANFPKSIECAQMALSFSEKMNDKLGIANSLAQFASLYYGQKEYNQALEKMQKSLLIYYELKDTINAGTTLIQTAFTYSNLNNLKEAVESCRKSILLFKQKKNKKRIIYGYNAIAFLYQENNDMTNALINFQMGLSMAEEMKDYEWTSIILNNMGDCYNNQRDFAKALIFSNRAFEISEKFAKDRIVYTSYILAKIYYNQKNYKKAKEVNYNAFKLWKKDSTWGTFAGKVLLLASQIDSASGNINGAYENYKQYIILRDKEKSDEVSKAATKEKFQTEYAQQKEIEKKEQEKKDAIAKEELKQQTFQRNAFIGGFALMLLLAGVSYRNFRRKKKDNLIITEQKNVVETKNKEIKDSIQYALRIQTAILPTHKIVKQYLQNSFILYKPKDIVAGDFYWMETVNDLVLFAACDCTGHGVPGAMVSVVCHNALNRAVREFGLTQPATILDKTAEIVIENFSKSEEDIKDGMDISLCAYNPKTKTIQWAGANNPLWLLQNGELIETKADKQPIGMNDNRKPFTNHTFTLQTGETIYLFTDGFADQFGGETGQKKLTKKRFKDLILSVQNKSLQEQGIALDKFISEYRKTVEQIDDILVMGVKV